MDFSRLTKSALIYSTPIVRVYKGTYESTPVVIKELYLASAHVVEIAAREFRIQQSLDHPNICKAYGCYAGEDGHSLTLVLEALEFDLAREITNRRTNAYPWQEADLWTYFLQLVTTFAYAQEMGICHRDIKPHNIFVTFDKHLKVGDFGTAKVLKEALTSTVVGTPVYASPELRYSFESGATVSYDAYRSDVYSLGLTFLCMIQLSDSPLGKNGKGVGEVIEGLEVSEEMKVLLRYMLQSEIRPDFLELRQYLYSLYHYSPDSQTIEPGNPSVQQISPEMLQALEQRLNSEEDRETALIELLVTPGVAVTWTGVLTCHACWRPYPLVLEEPGYENYLWFCSEECCAAYYQNRAETVPSQIPEMIEVVEGVERITLEEKAQCNKGEEAKETRVPLSNAESASESPNPPDIREFTPKPQRKALNILKKYPPKSTDPQKPSLIPPAPIKSPLKQSKSSFKKAGNSNNPQSKAKIPPSQNRSSALSSTAPAFQVNGKSCVKPRKSPF
jgi:serine/threonine protein kinase